MPRRDITTDDRAVARPLRVLRLIATRSGDPERGPMVTLNPDDAKNRFLTEGELAWVYGPRRQELAQVRIDADLPLGDVILRNVVGASPSEQIRVIKPDMDRARKPSSLA